MTVPAPIATSGPIIGNAPTVTSARQLRLRRNDRTRIDHFPVSGATIMSAASTSLVAARAPRLENFQIPLKRALEVRRQDELVAGDHGLAEPRLVDTDEIEPRVLVRDHARGDEAPGCQRSARAPR